MTTAQQREAFRRALRQARTEMGLSQRAVARAVGRTASAVWQWEEGLGAPNPPTVAELERLLEVEPDALARLLGYVPVSEASDAGPQPICHAVEDQPQGSRGPVLPAQTRRLAAPLAPPATTATVAVRAVAGVRHCGSRARQHADQDQEQKQKHLVTPSTCSRPGADARGLVVVLV